MKIQNNIFGKSQDCNTTMSRLSTTYNICIIQLSTPHERAVCNGSIRN